MPKDQPQGNEAATSALLSSLQDDPQLLDIEIAL
jgi:hypothetical protein